MNVSEIVPPYFGVFATDQHADYSYGLNYTLSRIDMCKFYKRADNSDPTWTEIAIPSTIAGERVEVIKYSNQPDADFQVDLGHDLRVCDSTSTFLSSGVDPAGKEFLWSTGAQTASIQVKDPGSFSLEVREGCKVDRDTVSVMFLNSPESFSLGKDEVLCEFTPRLLKVQHPADGFQFTWQDNSTDTIFQADRYGLYWLKISNACGSTSDSVSFVQADLSGYEIPNVITPNGDTENEFFILHPLMKGSIFSVFNRWGKQVHASASYQNDWNGSDLPSGVYYYKISGACLENGKGVIQIFR